MVYFVELRTYTFSVGSQWYPSKSAVVGTANTKRLERGRVFSLFIIACLCGLAGGMLEAWLYDQERKANK